MFKRAVRALLFAILSTRPRPPAKTERELIEELRRATRETPCRGTTNPSDSEWTALGDHLREQILDHDPREFLRWDFIAVTMFPLYASYINLELKYLKSLSDWKSRWRQAIREISFGRPLRYWRYPRSSGNLIHHAYHLAQFEKTTAMSVNDVDLVFEFGGGYGGMCRLFYNLGFQGKYVIFDVSQFSALQRFFLKSIGITVHSAESFKTSKAGVVCVSDIEQLRAVLPLNLEESKSMFIATYSISEAPIELRDSILQLVPEFQLFHIASQSQHGGVNNIEYFRKWKESQTDVEWHEWQIQHMGRNFYLAGKRRGLLSSRMTPSRQEEETGTSMADTLHRARSS